MIDPTAWPPFLPCKDLPPQPISLVSFSASHRPNAHDHRSCAHAPTRNCRAILHVLFPCTVDLCTMDCFADWKTKQRPPSYSPYRPSYLTPRLHGRTTARFSLHHPSPQHATVPHMTCRLASAQHDPYVHASSRRQSSPARYSPEIPRLQVPSPSHANTARAAHLHATWMVSAHFIRHPRGYPPSPIKGYTKANKGFGSVGYAGGGPKINKRECRRPILSELLILFCWTLGPFMSLSSL